MHSGIFPDILKTGIVSPVYKKGNPQLLDNYRPISTLPIFSKLFEKLIYVRSGAEAGGGGMGGIYPPQ